MPATRKRRRPRDAPETCPRLAVYVRVSSDEQARTGYSLELQEKRCREWCKFRYGKGKVAARICRDEGRQGTLGVRPHGRKGGQYRGGVRARMLKGKYSSTLPYGWQWREAVGPEGETYRREAVELVPEEAKWVEQMADWPLYGWGTPKIARELNRRGVRTRAGKQWEAKAVGELLDDWALARLLGFAADPRVAALTEEVARAEVTATEAALPLWTGRSSRRRAGNRP